MKEMQNLAWYKIPEIGWRIMHVSGRFSEWWHVTMLGAGMVAEVHSALLVRIDPSTVRHFHSEKRGNTQFECYVISPPPGLQGAPFHWYADLDGYYAGGNAPTETEAKQKALDLIDEKAGPR